MYNINTNIIKAKIYEKGYNINEVAEKLKIHNQTLSNWINYRNIDNISKFLELLIFLDIDIKEIMVKKITFNKLKYYLYKKPTFTQVGFLYI